MAVLKVRKYGDPILRRRAQAVQEVTPEIRRVVADMIETMYDEVGIGLAAPQVGISLRLMVVGDEKNREARALVNPVIAERSEETIEEEEGCLSIPGIYMPVVRHRRVKIDGLDEAGEPVSFEAEDLLAQVKAGGDFAALLFPGFQPRRHMPQCAADRFRRCGHLRVVPCLRSSHESTLPKRAFPELWSLRTTL